MIASDLDRRKTNDLQRVTYPGLGSLKGRVCCRLGPGPGDLSEIGCEEKLKLAPGEGEDDWALKREPRWGWGARKGRGAEWRGSRRRSTRRE